MLTPREREVLALIARGMPDAQIADVLDISEETVRIHVRNARGSLGVKTREEAVALAREAGEITAVGEPGAG